MNNRIAVWAGIASVLCAITTHAADPLIVHEWGTITTRHAPDGTPEGNLNRIVATEVLPEFVHQFEPPAASHTAANHTAAPFTKSITTPGRPDVTMRLETPVIYFYRPDGETSGIPLDVSVDFHGGILNEFYPDGRASVALDVSRYNAKLQSGDMKTWDGAVLSNYVVGSLTWSGITLTSTPKPPVTDNHAWLAPRAVASMGVELPSGESEQYLFYRGVAHLDALFQTETKTNEVQLRAPARLHWLGGAIMIVARVWLVDVRPDGTAAFSARDAFAISAEQASQVVGHIPRFTDDSYTSAGISNLRQSMRVGLIAAGLYEAEADAMLETWQESFFQTPGLRIFYLVPRVWTDKFLPLHISAPNSLTRVLVGRIDLLGNQDAKYNQAALGKP